MIEKRWKAVPPQLFTSNGTADGRITVQDTTLFKVKQVVVLSANTLGSRDDLEIKRITDINTMYVGPISGNIDSREDLSSYTVALASSISANEQKRSKVPEQEIERHTYEEEPTVARRVILVDKLGDRIDSVTDGAGKKRLAVDANISVESAEVNIDYPNRVVIANVPVATANTEQSFVLQSNSQRFAIKVRDGEASINLAFAVGETVTNYTRVGRGVVFDSGEMDLPNPFTIYYSVSKNNVVVEIINWYYV